MQPGTVTARVQGSRATPYRVRIGLTAFDATEWTTACAALAENAWYSAKLLAGEMPEDIEDVFASVGLLSKRKIRTFVCASVAEVLASHPCRHLPLRPGP